jgi:oligopeptidase B
MTPNALADTPTAVPSPPTARKQPKIDLVHGERREDDYFWLREKSNPEVAAYLEAENAYADAVMRPTEAFQADLYKEMLGRIQETDVNVPYRQGAYFYYSRTEQGKQYPIFCRKKATADQEPGATPVAAGGGGFQGGSPPASQSVSAPPEIEEEEITLDLNVLGEGQTFMALGAYAVSDDGHLLAYSTDSTGFRQYDLFIKDLRTGVAGPAVAQKTGSVAWAADNRTLFYSVEDDAKRHYRLYRHGLGSAEPDVLVFEEPDEAFNIGVGRTRSREYLILGAGSLTTAEARVLRADDPTGEWRMMAPRIHDQEYDVDHHDGYFYFRVNDTGRNFRLVKAPVEAPSRENWTEVIPHRADVMLEGVDFFKDFYVVFERAQGLPRLKVVDVASGATHDVPFPEPAYSVFPAANVEFETSKYRYSYESLVTPRSIFDYDVKERTSELLKEQPVLGGYDRTQYVSERLFATAPDGVRVPISLVYKKDVARDGSPPMLLGGYGSYGLPLPVTFSSARLSLLDRGLVVALAHIRGGGEMGKPWHDDGRMMKKRNTFTDFIAAAEHLVAGGYTSPDRLVIEGGSAGGLLMGAVTNMRPDLFKAVVSHVPFVDVVNTMLDASLPLTVGEYEEWGNPQEKAAYDYIKTYCPYTNLAAKDYPAMLVKTSFNDSQVMYWEPAKYVARLRTLKTDRHPLLLKTNMGAGHGGASGRYDRLHEIAFDYAFVLAQVGITQ